MCFGQGRYPSHWEKLSVDVPSYHLTHPCYFTVCVSHLDQKGSLLTMMLCVLKISIE
uniref:Uncharacterized protein n=1 Tax=Anguilla anguilla TaxID=7936 RepID=A0A0E9WJP4_ANGAN